MKSVGLIFVFVFWCLITLILIFSIVGLVLILPRPSGEYIKPVSETRSTWMWIGWEIKDKMLNEL